MGARHQKTIDVARIYDSGKIGGDIAYNSQLQAGAITLTIVGVLGHMLLHAGFAVVGLSISILSILALAYLSYLAYSKGRDIKKEINNE